MEAENEVGAEYQAESLFYIFMDEHVMIVPIFVFGLQRYNFFQKLRMAKNDENLRFENEKKTKIRTAMGEFEKNNML